MRHFKSINRCTFSNSTIDETRLIFSRLVQYNTCTLSLYTRASSFSHSVFVYLYRYLYFIYSAFTNLNFFYNCYYRNSVFFMSYHPTPKLYCTNMESTKVMPNDESFNDKITKTVIYCFQGNKYYPNKTITQTKIILLNLYRMLQYQKL